VTPSKKRVALAVAVLASLAVVAGAFGGTAPFTIVGASGAVGRRAHADLAVSHLPTMYVLSVDPYKPEGRLVRKTSVQAFAKPRQRVKVGYVMSCAQSGAWSRSPGVEAVGTTPFTVHVTPQPGDCRIYAEATLSGRGRLTLRVIARRTQR
jgi:hypothetical protein